MLLALLAKFDLERGDFVAVDFVDLVQFAYDFFILHGQRGIKQSLVPSHKLHSNELFIRLYLIVFHYETKLVKVAPAPKL